MALMLAKNRFGRMVLHLMCVAHDGKWRWHWAGICRELHRHGHRLHSQICAAAIGQSSFPSTSTMSSSNKLENNSAAQP
jgi:hypothetical protein